MAGLINHHYTLEVEGSEKNKWGYRTKSFDKNMLNFNSFRQSAPPSKKSLKQPISCNVNLELYETNNTIRGKKMAKCIDRMST